MDPDIESSSQPEPRDESVGQNVNKEVEGEQEEDYRVQLYRAALSGNWEVAREIHNNHRECFTEKISRNGDTALHIAAAGGRSSFVKKLLLQSRSTAEHVPLLESKNDLDNTAFCLAVASGALDIVEEMQRMKNDLPNIAGNGGFKPILMAALRGHAPVVKYLMQFLDGFNGDEGINLLVSAINTDMYEVALEILNKKKDLAHTFNRDGDTPLHVLARKTRRKRAGPLNIVTACEEKREEKAKRRLVERLWKIVTKQQPQSISNLVLHPRPMGLLFVAIELGNYEFVLILIRHYPDLIWELDGEGRTIFHAAVEYRQEKIYRHIYEIEGINHLLAVRRTTTHRYNILHLAARLPCPHRLNVVSGPALQMQRELLWFQEVEGFVQCGFADSRNEPQGSNEPKETPRVMFTREHASLRKDGEKWMRDTSKSCMIVATLVAAVVFQAIFQPPSKDNGKLYWTFVISDAFSLVSSTASILTFLAILTSRYAEEDFLVSLPLKLIIGLLLLFVSLMTMLLAFTVTIAINVPPLSLTIAIAVLAGITGSCYIVLHLPLLADAYRSTFRSNYLFRPRQRLFLD